MHLNMNLQTLILFHGLIFSALLTRSVTGLPTSDYFQSPLFRDNDDVDASITRLQPSLVEQNDTICNAGSRQWTGTVPLDENRDMFFWYFESRHKPADAPVIIWLNGGPGASSLLGAFHEIGPCSVTNDGTKTVRSNTSWTNFANMLFIDQPIGVGFSDPLNPDYWSKNVQESAIDMDKFLDGFFRHHFPHLRERPLHLAGESFGGKYCPVYADLMRRKFDSVILVDALINFPDTALGMYDHFCATVPDTQKGLRHGLNASTCSSMADGYPTCAKFGALCTSTYDDEICRTSMEKCLAITEPYMIHVVPGGQNPYDDRKDCIEPPICGRLGMEEVAAYLNRPAVQQALGFPHRLFEPVNMEFNTIWAQGNIFIPTTREIARLLDEKRTPVLVLNGNNDAIVNTEGVLRSYNSIYWSGQAAFWSQELQPWYYSAGDKGLTLGGQYKSVKNLTVVLIDESGHMAPHDQPEAVTSLMQAWVGQEPAGPQAFR